MNVIAIAKISGIRNQILVRGKRLIALCPGAGRLATRINFYVGGLRQLHLFPQMTNDFIHQENNRRAEPFGIIDSHNSSIEGFPDTPWRKGNHWMITVGTPTGLHNITLGRGSWLTGGRTYTLYIHHNNRDFRSSCIANKLLLQGNTRTGGRGQSLFTSQGGTKHNPHAGNFILHLNKFAAYCRKHFGHSLCNLCRRCNRITAKKADACR